MCPLQQACGRMEFEIWALLTQKALKNSSVIAGFVITVRSKLMARACAAVRPLFKEGQKLHYKKYKLFQWVSKKHAKKSKYHLDENRSI